VIARVVTKRDDARLALAVALTAAVGLALVVFDDIVKSSMFRPPEHGVYAFVALLILLGGIAPWLAWTRRGRTMDVRCDASAVTAGTERIEAKDVTGVSVAHGARGSSVAIARGQGVAFMEVERAEDAARIASSLRADVPRGKMDLEVTSRWLAGLQALVTLGAVVAAPLYYFAATHGTWWVFPDVDGKAMFGLGGVAAAEIAMVLLVVRRLMRGHAVAIGRGAWDAHVALHRVVVTGGEKAEAATADRAAQPTRVGTLARGDEGVGAWLARIDAIPSEQHAYRGDAMKKDVLWDTLGDAGAPVDERMAAARVLRRRYEEDERALVRVVGDPEVRERVEAALEEQEDAERRIQALGPLFRAR